MKNLHSSKLQSVFAYSWPLLVAGAVAGCATSSDLQTMQKRVDELEAVVAQARSDAQTAQAAAGEASHSAEAALFTSKQARATASEAAASAQRAENTAGEASNMANSALSVSEQARAVSSEAMVVSQRATQAAIEAKVKAYEASTKASNASFIADSMKSRQAAQDMPASGAEAAELRKGAAPVSP